MMNFEKRFLSMFLAIALLAGLVSGMAFLGRTTAALAPETELYSIAQFAQNAAPKADGTNAVWHTSGSGLAPDGGNAFEVPAGKGAVRVGAFPQDRRDYISIELDVKFSEIRSGIVLWNNSVSGGQQGGSIWAYTNYRLYGHSSGSNPNVALTPSFTATAEQWYHMEMTLLPILPNAQIFVTVTPYSGSTLNSAAAVTFTNVALRNFQAQTANLGSYKAPTCLEVQQGTAIANLKVSQARPDAVSLAATGGMTAVTAGDTLKIFSEPTRKGLAAPTYAERTGAMRTSDYDPLVTYELRDASGNPLATNKVSIDSEGLITAAADAPAMDIQVVGKCEGGVESAPLTLAIEAVDPGGDGPTIGPAEDEPTAERLISKFTFAGIQNETQALKYVTDNSRLGSINNAGNQYFTVHIAGNKLAPNGRASLEVNAQPGSGQQVRIGDFTGHQGDYLSYTMDIRFDGRDGAGFTPFNNMTSGGNLGTTVHVRTDGGTYKLAAQTGGSAFTYYTAIEKDAWYRLELVAMYNTVGARADMILTKYNGSELDPSTRQVFNNMNLRNMSAGNSAGPLCLNINPGTTIANLVVTKAEPDVLSISAGSTVVEAGGELQITATGSRRGIPSPMNSMTITYELFQEDGILPLTNPNFKISGVGLLEASPYAPAGKIVVKAKSYNGNCFSDALTVTVRAAELFEITKVGVQTENGETPEGGTPVKLAYIDAVKLVPYENPVSFIVGLFDDEGYLAGTAVATMQPDWMPVGEEVRVNLNMELPEDFDPATWQVRIFSWTGL